MYIAALVLSAMVFLMLSYKVIALLQGGDASATVSKSENDCVDHQITPSPILDGSKKGPECSDIVKYNALFPI